MCVCPCLLCYEACHWAPSQTLLGYRCMASRSACNSLGGTLLMCMCAWLCGYVSTACVWVKPVCSRQACQHNSVSQVQGQPKGMPYWTLHRPKKMSPLIILITEKWWCITLLESLQGKTAHLKYFCFWGYPHCGHKDEDKKTLWLSHYSKLLKQQKRWETGFCGIIHLSESRDHTGWFCIVWFQL